jgi:Uma2 family endonuclease
MDPDAVEAPPPVVVVEVLSPGTRSIDAGVKLAGCFLLPSVVHGLLVDPLRACVIHHRRSGAAIETRIVGEDTPLLDPPGIGRRRKIPSAHPERRDTMPAAGVPPTGSAR